MNKSRCDMQRELYESFSQNVLRFAYSIVKDTDLSHEIKQEAFTRAFEHWNILRFHPNKEAWLLNTVKNISKEKFRDTVNKLNNETEFIAEIHGSLLAEHTDANETGRLVNILSSEEYRLVKEKHIIGYSNTEIAGLHGLSVDACKM